MNKLKQKKFKIFHPGGHLTPLFNAITDIQENKLDCINITIYLYKILYIFYRNKIDLVKLTRKSRTTFFPIKFVI